MNRRDLAYSVAEILNRHLPSGVGQEEAEKIAADLTLLMESAAHAGAEAPDRRLLVITAIGINRPGVVFGISSVLADLNIDIVDLNQTRVRDSFAMTMMADPTESRCDFAEIKERLKKRAEDYGLKIYIQYEDLMRAVNRI